ncbi:hypothetical protein [Azospirillum argentinense]
MASGRSRHFRPGSVRLLFRSVLCCRGWCPARHSLVCQISARRRKKNLGRRDVFQTQEKRENRGLKPALPISDMISA